jgi:hypothetical protein
VGITNKQRGGQLLPGLGAWMDVPFDAANFSGQGGMTWAVTQAQVLQNRMSRVGNTVTWNLVIASSTLSGVPGTQLTLKAPTKAKGYATGNCRVLNGAPPVPGIASMAPNSPNPGYGAVSLPSSAAFVLGSLTLYFTISYEVDPS